MQAVGCGGFVLAQALVQDLFDGAQRTRQRILTTAASGVFISVSPLFGVVLEQHLGWRGSFYGFAMAGVLTSISAALLLPSTKRGSSRTTLKIATQAANRMAFACACTIAMLAFASHFSFIVLSPVIFLERLALSPHAYGLIMLGYGGTYAVGGVLASQAARRLGEHTQLCLGLALIAASGGIMLLLHMSVGMTPATVLVSGCVMTCGVTLARPAAVTAAMNALPGRAGTAAAGLSTITFIGGGAISFGLGLNADEARWVLPAALLALGAAGLGIGVLPALRLVGTASGIKAPAPARQ